MVPNALPLSPVALILSTTPFNSLTALAFSTSIATFKVAKFNPAILSPPRYLLVTNLLPSIQTNGLVLLHRTQYTFAY